MPTWLQHVKKVHASGNTSFKESLKRASASWKKQKASGSAQEVAPDKKTRRKKKKRKQEAAPAADAKGSGDADKKKRRRKRAGPKLPVGGYKNIDSKALT